MAKEVPEELLFGADVSEGVLSDGNDLAVNDVTSPRLNYSFHRKNLDAGFVWVFGENLAGVVPLAGPCFEYECFVEHGGEEAPNLLFRKPALGV